MPRSGKLSPAFLGFCIVFALSFYQCQPQGAAPPVAFAPIFTSSMDTLRLHPSNQTYAATKAAVNSRRQKLKTAHERGNITLDSVRQAFTKLLLDDIFPYWYGTDWDFDGHTAIPRQGQIACGYFVSTTLLDAGLNLNRYRLAQQAPETEARMLNLGKEVLQLESDSPYMAGAQLEKHLKDGLYFIGLSSSHVGYLLKREGQLIAIHSNYVMPSEVVAQPLMESVYAGFPTFYVAELTWNDRLLKHWLNGTALPLQ